MTVKVNTISSEVKPDSAADDADTNGVNVKVISTEKSSPTLPHFVTTEDKTTKVNEDSQEKLKDSTESQQVPPSDPRHPTIEPPISNPQTKTYGPPTTNATTDPRYGCHSLAESQVMSQTQMTRYQVPYPPTTTIPYHGVNGEQTFQHRFDHHPSPYTILSYAENCCQYGWQYQPTWVMPAYHTYQQNARQRYTYDQQPQTQKNFGNPAVQSAFDQHQVTCGQQQDQSISVPYSYGIQSYNNYGRQSQQNWSKQVVSDESKRNYRSKGTASGTENSRKVEKFHSTNTDSKGDHQNRKHTEATEQNARSPDSGTGAQGFTNTTSAEGGQWYRENHLSSDSGWTSDNCSSSSGGSGKDDGDIFEDTAPATQTMEQLSERLQGTFVGIHLENSPSASSADESFPESRLPSVSSQCLSASDDDRHIAPRKKQVQQTRVMRPIPTRFLQMLRAAADNAARQKKNLEGYPLFSQRHFTVHQNNPQMLVPDMIQSEYYSGVPHAPESSPWYFPRGYPKSPGGYPDVPCQTPNLGSCVQGLCPPEASRSSVVYTQQSPAAYVQGSYNQSYRCHGAASHCQEKTTVAYADHDQQVYCSSTSYVPLYVIQVDNTDPIDQCMVYNAGQPCVAYEA